MTDSSVVSLISSRRHRWPVIAVVDRADAVRRRRRREALDTVVSEHRHPWKAGVRGEPADTEGARSGPAAAERGRVPLVRHRRHQEPGGADGDGAGREGEPRARSRARTSRPATRCTYRATGTRRSCRSTRPGRIALNVKSGAAKMRAEAAHGLPAGITRRRDGLPAARGGDQAGLERRLERPGGSADRRARRADHPALRLRDAAGGVDAARRRGRGDPQHVHARLGADLHHRRLDHRAVPDRAGRSRRRDRLRAADGLPLPRRAP